MGQLFFKKALQQAIRSGQKTTTLRRWKRPMFEPGRRVYSLGLGWLVIRAVERIDLGTMTESDARADGFDSLKELLAILAELYPHSAADGKHWYRVTFDAGEVLKQDQDMLPFANKVRS